VKRTSTLMKVRNRSSGEIGGLISAMFISF
jgi:hypothetical protein